MLLELNPCFGNDLLKQIARCPRVENRDPQKTYNKFELEKLSTLAPGFDWAAFMEGAGLTKATRVVAQENTAFPKLAAIFAKTPIATLKAWQAFNLADQAGPYLSQPFIDTRFDFRGKTLNGQPAQLKSEDGNGTLPTEPPHVHIGGKQDR